MNQRFSMRYPHSNPDTMKNSLITRIRKSPVTKAVAAFMAIGLVHTIVYPTTAMALTSGPSQPEFQSFEPVEASNMVDLFSGDFTYNLPLFELPGPNGGYPFNMAYHSGITMDQEASWVGLGWNINPGVINRGVRGIPDDFTGYNPDGGNNKDYIHVKKRMLANHVYGISPGAGVEIIGADVNVSIGHSLSVYYNNYRGMGYSLSRSFGLGFGKNKNLGIGLNLSLDSQEGVGVNPELSLKTEFETKRAFGEQKFGIGVGFHSEQGFSYSLKYDVSSQQFLEGDNSPGVDGGEYSYLGDKNSGSIGSGHSFSSVRSGVPDTDIATKTIGLNLSLKIGKEIKPVFISGNFSGFWRGTYIREDHKSKWYEPIGYNYLEHSGNIESAERDQLQDYVRYKGGALNTNTSNLPFSQMTYDVYSVAGQGIGGVFRPHRNSFAHLHKNRVKSISNSFAAGFDIGVGDIAKFGVNGSYTYGQSQSGEWKDGNDLASEFTSETKKNTEYDDYYFKFQGERTTYPVGELNHLGGEQPLSPIIYKKGNVGTKIRAHGGKLRDKLKYDFAISNYYKQLRKRERSTNIQHYINRNMIDYSGDLAVNKKHIPGEYVVDYYDMTAGTANKINKWKETKRGNIIQSKLSDQATYKRNHIGGFSILKQDGSRYVYGIPVYNREKKEVTYSVDNKEGRCAFNTSDVATSGSGNSKVLHYEIKNSKKLLDYKATSPYATSYLITSILGADYVDTDGVPGPSDGDMGYWVKFNYIKTNKQYQWRAPFTNSRYHPGFENDFNLVDDVGSYQYGKKEVFYLSTVETSSHIAVFKLDDSRTDGYGASEEFNSGARGSIDLASKNYQLKEISLYTKDEFKKTDPIPIKRVHFDYNNALCKGIFNSSDNSGNTGKLTLKALSFSYGNNQRGKITPYTFDYGEIDYNPSYQENAIDRWGNHQTNAGYYGGGSTSDCELRNHPYTYQFDEGKLQTQEEKTAFKKRKDKEAAAWHLKTIGLPSGGKMEVNYEADDYAYVQHRKATQMFQLIGIGSAGQYNISGNSVEKRTVVFKLEHPIPTTHDINTASAMVRRNYLEPLEREGKHQLFFKIRVQLRKLMHQSVAGWATFNPDNGGVVNSSASKKTINGVECYSQGYIIVDESKPPSSSGFNPFEMAGFQHLRTNQPEMLTSGYAPATISPASSTAKMMRIKGLASFFFSIKKMFSNFYKYCRSRNFCDEIKLEDSYIRLATPDGVKYGGGVRVKSIEVFDNWGDMTGDGSESASYGQYYEYTTKDENKRVISSGVAANEPQVGGEENPLRYARFYTDNVSPKAWGGNNLFFEYPINEAYYPGASVGYSKVTVMSKNTRRKVEEPNMNKDLVASSGVTVSEFYTAKDYPVITKETNVSKRMISIYVPIPLIGMIDINKMGFGQGYSVVLNDMHGKPKGVTSYAISTDGQWRDNDNIVSSQEYVYKDQTAIVDGVSSRKLENHVTTLSRDFDWTNDNVPKKQMVLGEDYEFFMESNKNRSTNTMGGVTFDGDGFLAGILPLFITMFWPRYTRNVQEDNYAVVNKVIYKTGVLDKVVSKDEKATVTQKNEYYDELTGAPIVVSTTNKYHKESAALKTYQYQVPGYWQYAGMGAAYKNYDFVFKANVGSYNSSTKLFTLDASTIKDRHDNSLTWSDFTGLMHEGDELIASSASGKVHTTLVTLKTGATTKFYAKYPLSSGSNYTFRVIRSGRRNQLATNVGSTVSFSDPTTKSTQNGGNSSCSVCDAVAEFLNDHLVNGIPQVGEYDLNGNLFHPSNGNLVYYKLSRGYSKAEITLNSGQYRLLLTPQISGLPATNNNVVIGLSSHGAINQYTCSISGGTIMLEPVYVNTGVSGDQVRMLDSLSGPEDFIGLDNVLVSSAVILKDKWGVEGGASNPSNPFATGERGIFRPVNDYVYTADRLQSATLDLKKDGVYHDVDVTSANTRFYAFNWQPTATRPIHHYWEQNSTITKYNNKGFEVENRDALGVPSSAKYGYHGMLPVITGQNINYNSLFYLGADDPSMPASMYSSTFDVSTHTGHTGKNAYLKKSGAKGLSLPVSLSSGKKYVFSGWVSNGYGKVAGAAQLMDYTAARNSGWTGKVGVELHFFNSSNTEVFNSGYNASNRETLYPSGEKIEQWQRIEGEFKIPATATKVELHFTEPTQLSQKIYWDDLRVYPVGSLVKTFVYDPVSLRLLATLDENNYSVQYTYDESGNLYSTRVETPKGIRSISESRAYTKKQ